MDDFVVSDEDKFVILQQHVMKLSQKLEKAEDRITMLESLTPTSSPLKNTPTKKLRQKLEIAAEVVAGRQQEDLDEPSSSSSEEETEPTPTPAAVEEPAEPELREAPPKPPPGPGREEERRHRDLEKTKAEIDSEVHLEAEAKVASGERVCVRSSCEGCSLRAACVFS